MQSNQEDQVDKSPPRYGVFTYETPDVFDGKTISQFAERYFRENNIEPVDATMAMQGDPGNYADAILSVETNMFGMKLPATILSRYKIEIKFATPSEDNSSNSGRSSSDSDNGNGHDSSGGNGNGHDSSGGNGNGHENGENGNGHENGDSSNGNSETSFDSLRNMTKRRVRGDPNAVRHRNLLRTVWLELLKRHTADLGIDPHLVYYDLGETLYSLQPIKFPKKWHTKEGSYEIQMLSNPDYFPTLKFTSITFMSTGKVYLGDFEREINYDLSMIDAEMRRFLEIATSQVALFTPDEHVVYPGGKSYLLQPEKYGFSTDDVADLPGGTYVGIGSQKSIRYIEGPNGRHHANAAVLIDSKKTPFHKVQTVLEKAYELDLVNDQGEIRSRFASTNGVDAARFDKHFKGLYVEEISEINTENAEDFNPNWNKAFMRIDGIDTTADSTTKTIIANNGEEFTLQRYWREIKSRELLYPNAPLVKINRVTLMGILSLSYPMEVLQVCDNQRVSSDKQKPDLVSKLIRCAAILPRKMASTIEKHTRAHRLGLPNPWLDNANIKVFKEPVKVNARLLCHPSVQYQSENCALRDRCSWRFSDRTRYILPARCKSWVATYIHNGNGNGNDHIARQNIVEMLKEFMRQLVQLANSHGMDVSPPLRFGYVSNMLEMQECIQAMKKDNVEFAFFLTDDQIEDMHAFMKLLELQNDIVTQDLRLSTMENVVKNRKRITLENVILKMNVKLGGLNHNITINNPQFHNLLDPHTLFIGFGIDHPVFGMIHLPLPGEDKTDENGSSEDSNGENGNGSHEKGKKKDKETSQKPKTLGLELAPPTVVGVAANDGKHPFEFTGDYVFQTPSRDEKVMLIQRGDDDRLLLQDIIETIIERFQKNRGYLPSRVVVYRNGCSEGQYANVLSHEIPLIKHAMVRMKCGDAPLTFIVPNKMNNIRLIPEKIDPSVQKTAPEQNIKPGYVIDTKVVHPLWREFYLCSHTTIQGTAKIPRYTILYTNDDMSSDQLQEMTYALAYGHQIVNSSTSLPSPTYIAGRYAERGREVVNAFMATDPEYQQLKTRYREPQSEPERYAGRGIESKELLTKLALFNNRITLHNHETLRRRRINA